MLKRLKILACQTKTKYLHLQLNVWIECWLERHFCAEDLAPGVLWRSGLCTCLWGQEHPSLHLEVELKFLINFFKKIKSLKSSQMQMFSVCIELLYCAEDRN